MLSTISPRRRLAVVDWSTLQKEEPTLLEFDPMDSEDSEDEEGEGGSGAANEAGADGGAGATKSAAALLREASKCVGCVYDCWCLGWFRRGGGGSRA